jgi:hypothetical protein
MARKVNLDETEFAGGMKFRFLDVDVTSYDQGGEDLTPEDAGMVRYQKVDADAVGGNGYRVEYVEADDVLKVYDGGSELAGGSTATIRVMTVGR